MSERDWRDRKCVDCRFAEIYGHSDIGRHDLWRCRRFPPVRLSREADGEAAIGLSRRHHEARLRGMAQMTAPIRSMVELDANEMIAVVRRHQDVTEVFRMMQQRLGLTNSFIDDVGGLTSGHTDKILGPSESKRWGPTTFDLFCEMFAIEFRVYVDTAALARMEAVWEKRVRAPEWSHTHRVSKKLIEKAKPIIFSEMGKLSAPARMACLTPEQRSRIARKAAKSRWKKARAATVR